MNVMVIARWPVGGLRTYLKYIYRGILAKGYKCTFFIVDEAETNILKDDLSSGKVDWVILPKNKSFSFYVKTVHKAIRNDNFDLIHAHGFTSGAISVLSAKLTNTPIIMTSHDMLLEEQFIGFKGWLKRGALTVLFNLLTKVQTVSYDAKVNITKMLPLLNTKKITVIQSGIDESLFLNVQAKDLRGELGLEEGILIIGFFGRFMSPKGFRYIIDAVEHLKNDSTFLKKIIIITVGYGGFYREEVAEIKRRDLQSYFKHLDYVPNIAQIMKSVDVVVMPSLWEACGLLAMEAMVAGVPIISSDCVGLREVTKKTPALRVPVKDGLAIADAIKEIDESTQKDFQKFSQMAAKRYSVQNAIQQVDQMYKQVVHENS